MKPSELVEKAMKGVQADTRYALWKVTGISEAHLGHYANNSRWPSNSHMKALAEAAGLPWAEVLAELEMERAKDEQTRTGWGKALASLRSKAVTLGLAVVLVIAAMSLTTNKEINGLSALAFLLIFTVAIIFIM
jgi:hypothetical protein